MDERRELGAIERIGARLYDEGDPSRRVYVSGLKTDIEEIREEELEDVVAKMLTAGVVGLNLARDRIGATAKGQEAYRENCLAELVLGFKYIQRKFHDAVLHIVVRSKGTEYGAAGFVCADFANAIVTNAHVARGNEILRIENRHGDVLHAGDLPVRFPDDDLDLAILEFPMPVGLTPIRVDWRDPGVEEGDPVLVLGYPPFAGHHPALLHAETRVQAIPQRVGSDRVSIFLAAQMPPGCSGGPLLSSFGLAVGVMEQEGTVWREAFPGGGGEVTFTACSAIPARYLRDIK